ncbi:hypothetical protein FJ959_09880 [Mesorhizobium sp. B2-2-4]|uniref:glycoside hydrolase family 108 protein n=1 Tax=unclassified Mesorhizobium TaxID=325217 RepID=UPI00112DFF4F|nr:MULTISPECIES: glycosyl hydrolase 108 family protein [unclassified Mesorhizobium]TPM59168.1 hypothetical protein FJ959_09880 [Mesorhizobium sp. B2-2-4]TPM67653.1 hypothetical protein FJ965_11020 [Mesorhizobium sp. B2-2-1]TPN66934.1 hypothetical protein FJ984_15880 [Mesorhizobium sp. B1-1-3]
MDRNFVRALALVLKSEGGWSDNPKDPGGATMKGVTLANFRRYVKADATKADLRKITDDQVATVYRRFYWDAVAGAELPDGVDYAVFDFAVNSGPGRAAKYLQAVAGVVQDGRMGPATVMAAKAKPAGVVIDALCDARMAFLKRLPTWGEFGKGWTSRVASVRSQALLMSKAPAPTFIQPAVPPAAPAAPSVVVVTQQGNQPPVITPVAPAPSTAPTVPKSKTGWGLLGIIVAAIAAVIAKLHFGG